MSKNPLSQLSDFGQSFWYDNIQRTLLQNGDMQKMVEEDDMRGVTSNPSIFEKAIANSNDYDNSLAALVAENPDITSREAFFALAVEDIQTATDLLKPVYEKTNAIDGYVSLEVSPDLAHDTEASIKEAQELFLRLGKPNAMIKIPATKAGIPVIEKLISDGINVNATLLFSAERYVEVAKAYINGMATRHERGLPINNIASVASFFVSRVDVNLDQRLANITDQKTASKLMGRMAIANAKVAYLEYQALFESDAFKKLAEAGANPQRLLWASTGTKNPDLSDVLYIETLIGQNTVNTIPPATAEAFNDHGKVAATLLQEMESAAKEFAHLKELGVDVDAAMIQLEDEGVASFEKSFDTLLVAIQDKMNKLKTSKTHVA